MRSDPYRVCRIDSFSETNPNHGCHSYSTAIICTSSSTRTHYCRCRFTRDVLANVLFPDGLLADDAVEQSVECLQQVVVRVDLVQGDRDCTSKKKNTHSRAHVLFSRTIAKLLYIIQQSCSWNDPPVSFAIKQCTAQQPAKAFQSRTRVQVKVPYADGQKAPNVTAVFRNAKQRRHYLLLLQQYSPRGKMEGFRLRFF